MDIYQEEVFILNMTAHMIARLIVVPRAADVLRIMTQGAVHVVHMLSIQQQPPRPSVWRINTARGSRGARPKCSRDTASWYRSTPQPLLTPQKL